jgi:hypothetical protein
MRYRRLGSGKPLLVLRGREAQGAALGAGCEARGDALEAGVFDRVLAKAVRHRRVLTPEAPIAPDTINVSWLRGFMDGLGLTRATMVADEAFAVVALEVAMIDHDRIAALAVVCSGSDDNGALAGSLTGPFPETQVRLLVVRADDAAAERVADDVLAFLEGDLRASGH